MGKKRAATYSRVSSHTQNREDTYSLREQHDETARWCVSHGYEIVAEEQDVHSGGDLDERPGFSRIRDLIRLRKVDVIVAMTYDRLSRDITHQSVIRYECNTKGAQIQIELVAENIDDTPAGKLYQSVKGFMAEWQRADIRDKSLRGKRQRVREGRINPSYMPPYGFWWRDAAKSGFIIDPETGPIVAWIYDQVLSGKPLFDITSDLNRRGVLTGRDYYWMKSGQPEKVRHTVWREASLSKLLRNPVYYGKYESFRIRREAGLIEDKVTGATRKTIRFQPTDQDKRYDLPDAAPPIVTRDVWDAAKLKLAENRHFSSRSASPENTTLLRGGFVKCAFCKQGMYVRIQRRRDGSGDIKARYYMCLNHRGTYPRGCQGSGIVTHKLDPLIWDHMVRIFQDPQPLMNAAQREKDKGPNATTLESTRAVVADLDANLTKVARKIVLLGGEDDNDPLFVQYQALKARRAAAAEDLEELERQFEQEARRRYHWDNIANWVRTLADGSRELDTKEKRFILHAFGVSVLLAVGKGVEKPHYKLIVDTGAGRYVTLRYLHKDARHQPEIWDVEYEEGEESAESMGSSVVPTDLLSS